MRNISRRLTAGIWVLLSLLAWSGGQAGHAAEKLKLGEKVPGWAGLENVDGTKHDLANLDKAKAVVVVFTCNSCPVAQAYEQRFQQFLEKYREQGVELVAIHVSSNESIEDAQQHAKLRSFKFPYLHDAGGKTAKAFGAEATPHLFLLDSQHRLVYRGAFDDQMIASKVKREYLSEAVELVLQGKPVETAETRPVGCAIH
jgi:peroxiredoxin